MQLQKYVDQLPAPRVLQAMLKTAEFTYYEIRMTQFKQKLHRDLPPTTLWGYEGTYPGPTIEVNKGEHVKVKWINDLPNQHLLPVDKTIHGAEPPNPEVRTVVHLHGGRVPADSDGYPEAWFTRSFSETGPLFTTKIYNYPNQQRATTLWYHDHTLGITRLNVYAGLAGFYLIRDKHEQRLNLPKNQFEIPIVIQDRSFNEDGSLFYPSQPDPPVEGVNPSIVPEFFGETIVVNGKIWPFLEVEPRRYRFRILNGSNARFYRLSLDNGQPFFQIGTEGGLLEKTVKTKEIILGPAERADVILDFSLSFGKRIILRNDAPSPFPDGDPVDPETTGQIMQFRVNQPLTSEDESRIPIRLSKIKKLSPADAIKVRDLTLEEATDKFGRLLLLLDGKQWDDPVAQKPLLGSIEVWRLINLTVDTHPIHLHLVHFQILDRRPFDVDIYQLSGKIKFTGPAVKPDPNERGWKDTVRANPGMITRIISRFGPFTGLYPWHCHILEHEDNEMMRPYRVIRRDDSK